MKIPFTLSLLILGGIASAEIKTERVQYKQGDTVLEGFAAWDSNAKGKRPLVMIVHDWNGLDGYEEGRAKQLAALGYVAFAADIYGKGVRPTTPADCAKEATKYRSNLPLFRERLLAGFSAMDKLPHADKTLKAAMGYCFGGGGVMELARTGANAKAILSFHGAVAPSNPTDGKNIKGHVYAFAATGDPAVGPDQIEAFKNEMKSHHITYKLRMFDLNVHAFTVPGPMYNKEADLSSWADTEQILAKELKH